MAVGKNKRLSKGKKGSRKKQIDPFLKKEWYDIVAPAIFANRKVGKTLVTKTIGTKIAAEGLRGRIVEFSLADLNSNEEMAYRKIKLCIEEIQGYDCLTNFHGMDMTRDKLCSLIRKKQTIIEGNVDVRTTDGYIVRMFCIAFTKHQDNQVKLTCYAKSSQIRLIRAKMVRVMTDVASKKDLKALVKELIGGTTGEQITREVTPIFPVKDVFIRKVKVLKKPKFDITSLMEWHTEEAKDTGVGGVDGTATAPMPDQPESLVAGSGGRL